MQGFKKFEGAHHTIFTNPSPNPPPILGIKSNFGFPKKQDQDNQISGQNQSKTQSDSSQLNVNKGLETNSSLS